MTEWNTMGITVGYDARREFERGQKDLMEKEKTE